MRKRLAGLEEYEDSAGDRNMDDAAKHKPQSPFLKPTILVTVLTMLFLIVTLKTSHEEITRQSAWETETGETCKSYDEAYFSSLLERVQDMPLNASLSFSLCDPDLIQNCRCKNPFVAIPQIPDRVRNWQDIHQLNINLIHSNYTTPGVQPELALLGDSLTERLLGQMFGKSGPKMKEYTRITERLFTKQGGGSINGLPLGISSDEIPHLLYRLQNGELPKNLQPKVWWLLIGTNDARMGCSADVIVAGNLRIVEELRRHSDGYPPIVVNSLLPRGAQALSAPTNALWRILRIANQQLACYSRLASGILFANVTDKFVETRDNGEVFIHPDMFVKDNVHISTNGSRVWEEFMVQRVLSLLG